ncbi:hypothetical protein, partial [Staphylococcus aureus]
ADTSKVISWRSLGGRLEGRLIVVCGWMDGWSQDVSKMERRKWRVKKMERRIEASMVDHDEEDGLEDIMAKRGE